jgi:hypothetical protein
MAPLWALNSLNRILGGWVRGGVGRWYAGQLPAPADGHRHGDGGEAGDEHDPGDRADAGA